MLVRQRNSDAILAKFRGHVDEGQGGEILELIGIEKEGPASLRGTVGATESRQAQAFEDAVDNRVEEMRNDYESGGEAPY